MDEDPPSAADIMLSVLKEFRVADTEIAEAGAAGRAALYQGLLGDRRCLLVFDNARDESRIAPLLPRRGRGMCVVTSRKALTGLRDVRRMGLGVLSAEEAFAFLGGVIGQERARREAAALGEVALRCGYLPLALRIAGSRLATRTGWSVRRLADRLAVDKRWLDVLVAGTAGSPRPSTSPTGGSLRMPPGCSGACPSCPVRTPARPAPRICSAGTSPAPKASSANSSRPGSSTSSATASGCTLSCACTRATGWRPWKGRPEPNGCELACPAGCRTRPPPADASRRAVAFLPLRASMCADTARRGGRLCGNAAGGSLLVRTAANGKVHRWPR